MKNMHHNLRPAVYVIADSTPWRLFWNSVDAYNKMVNNLSMYIIIIIRSECVYIEYIMCFVICIFNAILTAVVVRIVKSIPMRQHESVTQGTHNRP